MKMGQYKANKKWRIRHPDLRAKMNFRYYRKHNDNPENRMQRYSIKEIEEILSHSMLDVDLAKKLKRSVKAIQMARHKYGMRNKN